MGGAGAERQHEDAVILQLHPLLHHTLYPVPALGPGVDAARALDGLAPDGYPGAAERGAIDELGSPAPEERRDGNDRPDALALQVPLNVPRGVQSDGFGLADWDHFNRSGPRDPLHDLHESEGYVVGRLATAVGGNGYEHPCGQARAAELPGALEEQVIGVEVLDEDGIAGSEARVTHQAAADSHGPAPARRPRHDDDQRQHAEPELPRGSDTLCAVEKVSRPA